MNAPDFNAARNVRPEITACPELDYHGSSGIIRALYYRVPDYQGRPARAFAYLGVPATVDGSPVPAVVLVHGGGGTAFAKWAELWMSRGYAAIAIDTNGNVPLSPGDELSAPDPEGLGGPPGNPELADIGLPIEEQWLYFAVSKVIAAHNLLRSDSRIDPMRIGLTGISWGGFIASLAIGHDDRFAFAVLVYGCGYLHKSYGDFSARIKPGPVTRYWEPSNVLARTRIPTLWLNGDRDPFFSPDANSRSADAAGGALTLLPNLGHGHAEGWSPGEIYRFADGIVGEGTGLIRITEQERRLSDGTRQLCMRYFVPGDLSFAGATLHWLETDMRYTEDNGQWRLTSEWRSRPIAASPDTNTLVATIPGSATWSYVNLTATDGQEQYTASSRVYEFFEGC
ncbi:MAG: Acetyl xylan esterase [Paenibacillus sp.]|jgi:dienelactone hydrolase|nr:Acetyl xylan esterase [Paenibacillus sp.]